jgi:hypothetical protein
MLITPATENIQKFIKISFVRDHSPYSPLLDGLIIAHNIQFIVYCT